MAMPPHTPALILDRKVAQQGAEWTVLVVVVVIFIHTHLQLLKH